MSILIKAVQRFNPTKPKAPRKWYPVQHVTTPLDENQVAQLVAEETTLNPAEALMAIRQLHKVVVRALLNSQSIKLGDWGSFSVTLHSEGATTEQALKATAIKSVNVVFHPGEAMKEELQKAEFTWVDKMANTAGNSNNNDDDDVPQG